MAKITECIKTLEKLSLLTCSSEVLPLLERTLKNVEPILGVDTRGVEPQQWQNELNIDRLHNDQTDIRLSQKDLKSNSKFFFEDYITIGRPPEKP